MRLSPLCRIANIGFKLNRSGLKMATLRPVAVVSPMRKPRSPRKRNKPSPRKPKKTGNCAQLHCDSESERSYGTTDKKSNRLCSMFENLNFTPEVNLSCGLNKNINIPDHDRKILERLAAKMKKDLANIEIAHRAHILWENEREAREKLQKEQEAEYKKYIEIKRRAEKDLNERKYQDCKEIFDWENEHLRDRIYCKENATASRIRQLELQRNKEVCRKHEAAQEKARHAVDILKEHKLAEVVWRRTLAENIEVRTHNAETNRDLLLKFCRQKAIIDNKVHQELQRRNWEEQRLLEMEHLSNLKRKLADKNRRMQRIQTAKENSLRQSRHLADSTAKLRDELKRSLSPDVFKRAISQNQHRPYKIIPKICFTPNSFESHIRLG